MTQAVSVRRDGDTYQARNFWLVAAAMLDEQGAIARVGFESGTKGFDDVWVLYDRDRCPQDARGNPIHVERHQCKWHARMGDYTHADLTRPEFINAASVSFLQRAHQGYIADLAIGLRPRLRLVTNHRPSRDDVLHGLIHTRTNSLRVDELYEGKTPRSAVGAARKCWADHLGLDDMALKELCLALQFAHTRESLEDLQELMNDRFARFGLQPMDGGSIVSHYDQLPFAWAAQGRVDFDKRAFHEACRQADVLAKPKRTISFGVKSFEHSIDRLEDRCEDVLDLVPAFNDRFIRDTEAWRAELQPRIQTFLREAARRSPDRLRLSLDAHASLAFAAGAVLDTKSGRIVELEQRTPNRRIWAPDDEPFSEGWPTWRFDTVKLDAPADGVALAVCITHDVLPKVQEYLARSSVVGAVRVARLTIPPGQQAIVCGAHASVLAEALAAEAKRLRSMSGTLGRLHLFVAAPNAFSFYLGRHVHSLKPLTLYEFDFDAAKHGTYEPSLHYPDNSAT